jgi:hypothetical protein
MAGAAGVRAKGQPMLGRHTECACGTKEQGGPTGSPVRTERPSVEKEAGQQSLSRIATRERMRYSHVLVKQSARAAFSHSKNARKALIMAPSKNYAQALQALQLEAQAAELANRDRAAGMALLREARALQHGLQNERDHIVAVVMAHPDPEITIPGLTIESLDALLKHRLCA